MGWSFATAATCCFRVSVSPLLIFADARQGIVVLGLRLRLALRLGFGLRGRRRVVLLVLLAAVRTLDFVGAVLVVTVHALQDGVDRRAREVLGLGDGFLEHVLGLAFLVLAVDEQAVPHLLGRRIPHEQAQRADGLGHLHLAGLARLGVLYIGRGDGVAGVIPQTGEHTAVL